MKYTKCLPIFVSCWWIMSVFLHKNYINMILKNSNNLYIINPIRVFLLMCLLLLGACKHKNPKAFLMKGELANLETAEILVTFLSSDSLVVDTVLSNEKGVFRYETRLDTLTALTLYFNNQSSSLMVFGNKGDKIAIKGDVQLPDLIEVSGNEVNDELTRFKKENHDLLEQRAVLLNNLKEMQHSDSSAAANSITGNEEMARINSLNHQLLQKTEEFIKENPAKISSLVLIGDFFANEDNPAGFERVLGYMDESVLKTSSGQRLKMFSEKINRSSEGATAPYFSLKDNDGKNITSESFKGKYLVLSFVSASGDASRNAIEKLKEAYKTIRKDSVSFVTVYVDSDTYPIDVKNDSIRWVTIAENKSWTSDLVDMYNIQYVPTNILISPLGTIVSRDIPVFEITARLNSRTDSLRKNR